MEFAIRAHGHDGAPAEDESDFFQVLMICPPSWDNWVSCDNQFQIPPQFNNADISRYEVVLTTIESYSVDYDVDNLSIDFLG